MKLGFSKLNYKPFHDEQKFKSKPRLHNLFFAGLKLVFHSMINGLHNSLGPYPLGLSFVQSDFPYMAQSCHFHFDKALLLQLSTS